jgi:peptide methionine sulfoxide reductase MsrB
MCLSRFISFSFFLGIGLLLALSLQSAGDEAPSKTDVEKNKKYRDLIEQLASPNKAPSIRNTSGGSVKFPAGYDVEAQIRIKAARQELHDNFGEALPFLIEALDDKRYSMTIDWAEGDAYYNYSVGKICHNVIASQLEVYRSKIRFAGPPQWNKYNYPISKKWWQVHKDQSLVELQIEAINWAIEQHMSKPKEEIGEARKNEIFELEKLRDDIAKSGKTAKPQRMLRMITSDK